MKKQWLFFLLSISITGVYAQNKVIKGNVYALVSGYVEAYYEVATGKKGAILLHGTYQSVTKNNVKFTAISAGINYKFYLLKAQDAPRGFYLSPGIGVGNVSVANYNASATPFFMDALLGYQWIWENGLALDLFAGIVHVPTQRMNLGQNYFDYGGTDKMVGVAIGYAFGQKKSDLIR